MRLLDPVLSLAPRTGLEEKTSKSKKLNCLLASSPRRFEGSRQVLHPSVGMCALFHQKEKQEGQSSLSGSAVKLTEY